MPVLEYIIWNKLKSQSTKQTLERIERTSLTSDLLPTQRSSGPRHLIAGLK